VPSTSGVAVESVSNDNDFAVPVIGATFSLRDFFKSKDKNNCDDVIVLD
jgi:hypothetical protein